MAPPAKPGAMRAARSCFTWSLLLLALAGCAGQPQQAAVPGQDAADHRQGHRLETADQLLVDLRDGMK